MVFGNWWRKQAYRMIAEAEALSDFQYRPTPRLWEKQVKRMESMLGLKPGRLRILHSQPPFFEILAALLLSGAWYIVARG
jgi:hypothetical protein